MRSDRTEDREAHSTLSQSADGAVIQTPRAMPRMHDFAQNVGAFANRTSRGFTTEKTLAIG